MKNFDSLGLSPVLAQNLAKMNYTTPTPIQAEAIPLAMMGRDVMGSAQTGTGKTAAYAIPAVEHLMNNDMSTALILTPTRELGKQVMDIMNQMLGYKNSIKSAFIIGGEPMRKQFQQLERRPRLIVGTPGRINDHLERGSLDLNKADFLVLDETDRMLDMGFSVQLDRIFKYMPKERQTLMFSATLPPEIMRMSKSYLTNPERIAVGSTIEAPKAITQQVIKIDDGAKYDELARQLNDRDGTVIMFVKTKFGTERMAKRLRSEGFEAEAIHGDLKQSRRERVIRDYRAKKFRILVATDVVARGLDIPHIKHVVNYDLPQVPEDFIHRIGRTARAGEQGEALSFVTPKEGRKWHAIEMLMDPDKVANDYKSGRRDGFKGKRGDKRGSFSKSKRNNSSGAKSDARKTKHFKGKAFKGGKNGGDEQSASGAKFRKPNKRAERYGDNTKDERNNAEMPREKWNAKKEGEGKAKKKAAFKSGKKPFNKDYDRKDRSHKTEGAYGDKPFAKSGKKPYGKKPSYKSDGNSEGKSFEKKSYGGKKPFSKDGAKSGGKFAGKSSGKPNNKSGGKSNGFNKPKRNDGSKPFKRKTAA